MCSVKMIVIQSEHDKVEHQKSVLVMYRGEVSRLCINPGHRGDLCQHDRSMSLRTRAHRGVLSCRHAPAIRFLTIQSI